MGLQILFAPAASVPGSTVLLDQHDQQPAPRKLCRLSSQSLPRISKGHDVRAAVRRLPSRPESTGYVDEFSRFWSTRMGTAAATRHGSSNSSSRSLGLQYVIPASPPPRRRLVALRFAVSGQQRAHSYGSTAATANTRCDADHTTTSSTARNVRRSSSCHSVLGEKRQE